MSDKPLTDVTFSSFDLHPALIAGLESAGFTRCTPIQALTLPVALPGGDVAGQAQTGTGKTLAFLVAVMNRLLIRPALADRKPEDPRALILAPTRELAIQIHKDAVKFGADLGLRFALVYGGVDYDKQRELLQQGVDVIIATPGRLIDYVKQHKVVSLHACEICVLDEADRMFDLGFIKDIRFLLRRMPERGTRQTLLFSATLSHRVLELAYEHMNEPEKLVVETESITAARVRQRIYFPSDEEKQTLLLGLLSRSEGARTMVFVNTKAFVERVARTLERHGYRVGVLSGDVPQKKRESLLNRFQKGQLEILVATDVAARGLHIDGVKYVYNYDLPFDAEDYVHRIGRTARLGEEGDAISFACERYAMSLPDIEAYIEQKIPVEPVTSELLTPLPRAPRVPVEGEEADDDAGDSVGTIFREAREQRAAEEQRRGGGRGGPGGGSRSGSGGGRRDGAGADGKPRPRRKPRVEGQAPATSAPSATPVVAAAAVEASSTIAADAERAPRKRRRRRNGRPVEGAEPAVASTPVAAPAAPRKPTQVVAKPVRAAAKPPGSPSLLSRIGRRLRSLVSGN
ncbi:MULTISPECIES: ATP-dependent RNA helicase RhlB [Xanthomonas]|uniref:ATP-dependent RNA helicase RhlB n=1 Tax=Xanthomonas phaseoli pv. dieffenbachiae TaxID=92828 RepID=A0A1V9H7F8_9XANT|nr:ATP-dependent RNA helicase RhlB [Xanthomonas phaseoli]MBO9768729.1 ATP-dependent RNA helicase RhlB [Xanthomonas phaseoli pv. dieffenbachiae]MBO9776928.1 ATP-dependent RNA helicase RhlB [Xanthomonas phaseoli pv. dieffenbachiae]MBO9781843.1 ATP-dependent RNA helicase RhlB [Xanthomonas phaseoli pv. dieffenbachiae]MBO9787367.1 ATP-dependent RNA helicase RhlB [Xanthomonas phaseoli pv. dieffenbachiae]MBO9797440.1 ATP-dependent RNA helicase RhlB [Xanthomonas phaseoli pv. dieffenbachiae]